jgi:hypothetical protein
MNLRSGTAFGVQFVFAAPPEVAAIAETSGYFLPTLRVEDGRVLWQWRMNWNHEPRPRTKIEDSTKFRTKFSTKIMERK